jgi:8-oxo-dGTP pyrophosphatase MutT (NUDIX family)
MPEQAQGTAPDEFAIRRFERLELAFVPRRWPFADQRRAEIDRHFAALQERKPVWNGRVLLLHGHRDAGTVFRGDYLETDFASFLAWRDWGCPDAGVTNCFGMGALRGRDGAFVLGVMAERTANAGRIYFPAGVVDPTDVAGGTIDLGGNVLREVEEETGLGAGDFEADAGWYGVFAGPRIALIKILRARETTVELRERIRAHLAQSREPELADVRIAARVADLDPAMPPYVTAFLHHVWSAGP